MEDAPLISIPKLPITLASYNDAPVRRRLVNDTAYGLEIGFVARPNHLTPTPNS